MRHLNHGQTGQGEEWSITTFEGNGPDDAAEIEGR